MSFSPFTTRPVVRRDSGFTLIEMMVTLGITVVLVLGLLALFDFSGRVTAAQVQIANMQQVQRVAQYEMVRLIRMAGRGGLLGNAAFELRNDQPADARILAGSSDSSVPVAMEGSDVVVVRGVLTSNIFHLNTTDATSFVWDQPNDVGFITVRSRTPTGVDQEINDLERLLGSHEDIPEALVVASAVDATNYVIVELDPSYEDVTEDDLTTPPTDVIKLRFITNGSRASEYQALSTSTLSAPQMQSVAYVGILKEYRFYVRDQDAPAGTVGSTMAPELARARVYPGTEEAYRSDPSNLSLPVAEDVLDLQVALGFDADADGVIDEGAGSSDRLHDEWRFNVASDATPAGPIGLLRLTTLVRTGRPDPGYTAALVDDIEDHSYQGTPINDDSVERRYRRWPLQTFVELRNL